MALNKKFKIVSDKGNPDVEIEDGVYLVTGRFTLRNGTIVRIDNSNWNKVE